MKNNIICLMFLLSIVAVARFMDFDSQRKQDLVLSTATNVGLNRSICVEISNCALSDIEGSSFSFTLNWNAPSKLYIGTYGRLQTKTVTFSSEEGQRIFEELDDVIRLCHFPDPPPRLYGHEDTIILKASKEVAFTSRMQEEFPGIAKAKDKFLRTKIGELFRSEGMTFYSSQQLRRQ